MFFSINFDFSSFWLFFFCIFLFFFILFDSSYFCCFSGRHSRPVRYDMLWITWTGNNNQSTVPFRSYSSAARPAPRTNILLSFSDSFVPSSFLSFSCVVLLCLLLCIQCVVFLLVVWSLLILPLSHFFSIACKSCANWRASFKVRC